MKISHSAGMALFALLVSVGFAGLGRRTTGASLRQVGWSFLLFMAAAIALAWLLYPLSR